MSQPDPAALDVRAPEQDAPEALYRVVTRRVSWSDIRATFWFLLLAVIGLALSSIASGLTAEADQQVRALLTGVPTLVLHIALVVLQSAAILLAVAALGWLIARRRGKALLRVAAALVLAGVGFWGVSQFDFEQSDGAALAPVAAGFGPVVSSYLIAAAAAVVAALRTVIERTWLAALWVLVVLLAIVRTLASPSAPLDVILAIGVGGVAGTAVLLTFGAPIRELTSAGVAAALGAGGLQVQAAEPSQRPGWQFRAVLTADPDDGSGSGHAASNPAGEIPLAVRVVDRRTWEVDTVGRAWRRLRLRDKADDIAHPSPLREVTAEALAMMLAREHGVNVPHVRTVTSAVQGAGVLAADVVPGPTLQEVLRPAGEPADAAPEDEVPQDEVPQDAALRSAWRQIAGLHRARIAHHALSLDHLRLVENEVSILDFSRAEPGSDDIALDGDVAEFLAASYARVGADRAVAAALETLGPQRVAAATRRLLLPALTSTTRSSLKGIEGGLQPLVDAATSAVGIEKPEFAKIERFKPRTLLMAAAFAVVIYVLAPQLEEFSRMGSAFAGANWVWLPFLALASAATYVGCGLGITGSSPGHVSTTKGSLVALAGSFVALFSPPGVSSLGLNVRFLQKAGYPTPVAISASAAKETATGVMHVFLVLVFALWAGSSGALNSILGDLPPTSVIILVVLGVLMVVGITFAVPVVRRFTVTKIVPAVRDAAGAMKSVMASPRKLTLLLGGVTLVPLGFGAALFFAVRALDPTADFVAIMLVSLTAGAVASAAPTPGGIGAVEAVLTAALAAIGIASSTALASVLIYRAFTFWIPIPPGGVAFRMLTSRDVL